MNSSRGFGELGSTKPDIKVLSKAGHLKEDDDDIPVHDDLSSDEDGANQNEEKIMTCPNC